MSKDDINYIEVLEKRLQWFADTATDEEFNQEEVASICQILNRIKPIEVDVNVEKGLAGIIKALQDMPQAMQEIKDNPLAVQETQDHSVESIGMENTTNFQEEMDGAKVISNRSDEIANHRRRKSDKRKYRYLRKAMVGVASFLVIFMAANMGTYATSKMSLFEMLINQDKGIKVIVNGQNEEGKPNVGTAIPVESNYESWEDLQASTEHELLVPSNLPEGMILQKISKEEDASFIKVKAKYYNIKEDEFIEFTVSSYDERYIELQKIAEEEKSTIEKELVFGEEVLYYQEEEKSVCYFVYNQTNYQIVTNLENENLKTIVKSMINHKEK